MAGPSKDGGQRTWSWMQVTDSFPTVSGTEEYSLRQDVQVLHELWIQGTNRTLLVRIPTTQRRRFVPDPSQYSGVPTMWDEAGVDTTGAKIVSLFPVPGGVYTVYYRFHKHVLPARQDQQDLRAYWGMPANVIECVIQMATALSFKGIDDDRYQLERGEAETMVDAAYAVDQVKGNTTIRVPANNTDDYHGGPKLPPAFGPSW